MAKILKLYIFSDTKSSKINFGMQLEFLGCKTLWRKQLQCCQATELLWNFGRLEQIDDARNRKNYAFSKQQKALLNQIVVVVSTKEKVLYTFGLVYKLASKRRK